MNCILFVVYNKTIEKREKSLDDGAHFFLLVAMADGGNSSLLLFKTPTRFPLGRCFYMPMLVQRYADAVGLIPTIGAKP